MSKDSDQNGLRPGSRRRAGRRIATVLSVAISVCGASAATADAQAPTVSNGSVVSVTTTGALIQATINPNGDDTLYAVQYGPAGGALSQTTTYSDAGSGTSPVTVTIPIPGLTPNTAYSYQVQGFQNDVGQATNAPTTGSFTTTSNPTGPGTPYVPPQNPPTDGIFNYCATDALCISDLNGDGALQEGLPPVTLPSNWTTLTPGEQIFVATNLERVVRGEAAIPTLVNTYDANVQTGITNDTDPMFQNVPGGAQSIWAGAFPTPLGAMYGWMDNDGPGGSNLDCTTATAPGCFGHRDAILSSPGSLGNPNEMDALEGTDANGASGYAAIVDINPNPAPAANVVMTWASEQQYLAPPQLGGTAPTGPTPVLSRASLNRTRFRALSGAKAPTVVLTTSTDASSGTIVSYHDSQRATTTLTVKRTVAGLREHGRCVAGARARKGHKATACVLTTTVGSFSHVDAKGANRFRFTGRLSNRKLSAGTYVLSLAPVSATGKQGKRVTVPFAVIR